MDYIKQSRAAWRIAQKHGISWYAWGLYCAMFMLANDSFNLGGDIKLSNPEMAALIHVTNLACLRAYKKELIEAGMLVVVDSGMHGRGNAGVYRLADLTDGRQMYGNQRAVNSKTVVEPLAETEPEATGDLFSEKKTLKRKKEQQREPEPKREISNAVIEAARRVEAETTSEMFAEARARREAAWKQ